MSTYSRLRYLWLVLGWLLVGFVCFASLVTFKTEMVVTFGDKVAHGLTYFVLMLWFSGLYRGKLVIFVVIGLVLLGVCLEIAQHFTQYRSFEIADMLANSLGVLLGLVVAMLGLRNWPRWIEALVEKLIPSLKRP